MRVITLRFRLFLTLLCLAGAAHAADAPSDQAADDSRRSDAKARYEQGAHAYASGHFKDAVDLFLAADRLSPSAPLSFNIARAYEKLGDDSGALRWYRDYLRRSPNAANAADVKALVERFEGRLAAKGVQQLTVLSQPAGATVNIDDTPVGVTPGTFDLAPGRHRLVLMLRGHADATGEVDLAPDRAQDVSFRLALAAVGTPGPSAPEPTPVAPVAPPGPSPAPAPAPAAESRGLGIWPWVVLGTGGAVLGGALVFELLREGAERDAERETTQIGYKDKLDSMESRRTTARILAGVGGTLILAGGVMLVLDLSGGKAKSAATLLVEPTPGGLNTTLAGRF
jgi:tetratricopeptide (TPR) repeat protein